MKTRFWIPAVLAATFSAGAFAHGGDRDQDRDWRSHRWEDQRYEHRVAYMPPPRGHAQAHDHDYEQRRGAYPRAPHHHAESRMPHEPQRVVARTIGAVAGGVIGHQVGDGQLAPTLIGAVIGGVVGDRFAR